MSALKIDPARARTITLVDLLFVAALTFFCAPAISAALGYAIAFATVGTEPALTIAGIFIGFGYTALFAWMAIPIAIAVGWLATRKGWIGWAAAPCLGALGGLIFGTLFWLLDNSPMMDWFLAAAFVPAAILYAIVGWASLRWLRADVFAPAP